MYNNFQNILFILNDDIFFLVKLFLVVGHTFIEREVETIGAEYTVMYTLSVGPPF